MMKDLRIWARNQLERAERKTGFSKTLVRRSTARGKSIGRVSRDPPRVSRRAPDWLRERRKLDTSGHRYYYRSQMPHAKSEAVQEWIHAGSSTASMYGNFFFWLFREPFPARQLGQQIVRVMLEGFGILAVAGIVEGAMFAWLAGWYGTKFSVVNWAGAASIYLLLSAATTLFGAMMFAAKIGTAFTVEIGSMQMSGQLDALRLMAVEPTQHIVIPRVLASILCLPVLKAVSDACAIGSAIILARVWFDISVPVFLQHALLV